MSEPSNSKNSGNSKNPGNSRSSANSASPAQSAFSEVANDQGPIVSGGNEVIKLADYKAPDYNVWHVDLDFDIQDGQTIVDALMRVRRNSQNLEKLVLDGEDLELLDLQIDGSSLEPSQYTKTKDGLEIDVPGPGREFILEVKTRIKPEENTQLMGLYKSGGNWCTQCESDGFRRITYFPDRPDNLATFTTRITADESQAPVLLSNGNLIEQGTSKDGRHYAVWDDPHPKPSYLFALVGGELDHIEDKFETAGGREVTLRIYAENKDLDKLDHAMESLKKSMRWDEEVYGREYDLDLFNIVAIDDFNMGAMENKSLNIFNTKYVLAHPDTQTDAEFAGVESVIAHEYFHNWTGNRVTCRDWFQLCLKEGLTVFRDQEFSADMNNRDVKRISDVVTLREAQIPEDKGPGVHAPRPDQVVSFENLYTATVYEKGAEINRMLHTLLGPEDFRKASDMYFERFDGQAVTVEDWVDCMEQASGRDLSQFMLWYRQGGIPSISASWKHDPQTNQLSLTLEQDVPKIQDVSDGAPRHIPVEAALVTPQGEVIEESVIELTKARQEVVFENVPEGSVPSLLRGYSAPVELARDTYSAAELAQIMRCETDGFALWNAGQQLMSQEIHAQIDRVEAGEDVVVSDNLIQLVKDVLGREDMADDLKAEALLLPGEGEISSQRNVLDPNAVRKVRDTFRTVIGERLFEDFARIYEERDDKTAQYRLEDAAARRLKNLALTYMSMSSNGDHRHVMSAVCDVQYDLANNMTDRLAGLRSLTSMQGMESLFEEVLGDFYDTYKDDSLTVNKWLSLNAQAQWDDPVARIKELESHEAMENPSPNAIRALYRGFATSDAFHNPDGTGYDVIADFIARIDSKNRSLSSGLANVFSKYPKLTPELKEQMGARLEQLASMEEVSQPLADKLERFLGKQRYAEIRNEVNSAVKAVPDSGNDNKNQDRPSVA